MVLSTFLVGLRSTLPAGKNATCLLAKFTRGPPFDNVMISALTLFSQVSYRRTTLDDSNGLLPATFALGMDSAVKTLKSYR